MRLLQLLPFVLSLDLSAQFVSSQGGVLHFFSQLIPRGSNLPAATRLLRFSPTGFSVEATLQIDPIVDILGAVDASADGSVVSYWSERHPLSPNPFCTTPGCYYPVTFTSGVQMGGTTKMYNRAVELSSTRRYAALFDFSGPPQRLDLSTGEAVTAPLPRMAAPRQAITSDGRLLLAADGGNGSTQLVLWSPAGQVDVVTIPAPLPAYLAQIAVIAASGSTVAWMNPADNTVHAVNVASRIDRIIANPPGSISQISISDTGDLVTYVLPATASSLGQLFLVHTDNSGSTKFTDTSESIGTATLQGDGTAINAMTSSGRALRISTSTLHATELWNPPPVASVLYQTTATFLPGSFQRITGQFLTSDASIGKTKLDVLSASPQEVHVQVPFDAPGTTDFLRFASDSPLEQVFSATIQTLAPRFLTYWDAGIAGPNDVFPVIVHGDYSGFIASPSTPASLGETVNLYLSGLGPVSPAVATGAVLPSNPPALLMNSIKVTEIVSHRDLPVVFAGLAPALTGVYLVCVQIPADLDTSPLQQRSE